MTDLATLSFAVDSQPLKQGAADLRAFGDESTKAGKKVEESQRKTAQALADLKGSADALAKTMGAASDRIGAGMDSTAAAIAKLTSVVEQMGKATAPAAEAADDLGDSLERLRARFNPLFAASRKYEKELEDIARAEKLGAISAMEAARARERAARVLAPMADDLRRAGNAAGENAMMFRNLAFQLNQIGQTGAVTGQWLTAVSIQLPDILASFGSLPLVLAGGALALGASFLPALIGVSQEAGTAEERIDALRGAVDAYTAAAKAARAPTAELAEQFGTGADAARIALVAQEALARANALAKLTEDAQGLAASLEVVEGAIPQVLGPLGRAGAVRSGQANAITAYEEAAAALSEELGISGEAADEFYRTVQRLAEAAKEGPYAIESAAMAAHGSLIAAAGGADALNAAARTLDDEILNLAVGAREFAATMGRAPGIMTDTDAAVKVLTSSAETLDGVFADMGKTFLERMREALNLVTEMGERSLDAYRQYQSSRVAGEFVADQAAAQAARDGDYLGLARTMLGRTEAADRAAIMAYFERGGVNLDPVAEAWCAAFVNATLEQAGLDGTNSNLARSFLQWGREVQGMPQVGDIGVLPRGNDPRFGHVGIVSEVHANGDVVLLGGNQGPNGAVSEQIYSADEFLGFRRADPFGVEAAAEAARDAAEAEREAARAMTEASNAAEQAQSRIDGLAASLDPAAARSLELAEMQSLLDEAVSGGAMSSEEAAAKMGEFTAALDAGRAAEAQSAIDQLRASLDPAAAAALEFAEAERQVNAAIAAGVITAAEGQQMLAALTAQQIASSDAFREAQAEMERQAEEIEGIWQDATDSIVSWMLDGFEGGFDSLLDIFKNTLKALIAQAVRNPITVPVQMQQVGGVSGLGFGGNIGQGMGLPGMGGGGLLGGLGSIVSSFSGGFSSVVSGFLNGGFAGAGTAISSALGAASTGIAGLAGAIGAIAAPVAAAIGLFKLFKGSTEVLETGLGVAIKGLDKITAWTWEVTETSRLGGLLKSTSSSTEAADPAVTQALGKAFGGISEGILDLGKTLGVGADALEKFRFNILLNTEGMDDEQIQQELIERLQAASDKMAKFVGVTGDLIHEGETATEALARLSATLPAVNEAFGLLGFNLYEASIQGAAAAARIADVFGGLDAATSGLSFYFENFYSQSERVAALSKQFAQNVRALNVGRGIKDMDDFRARVDALMAQGRDVAAAGLIALAPLFKGILNLKEEARAADDARRDERQGLLMELWELQGKTNKLRKAELQALDPANRALQKHIWQLEDMREAVEGLSATDFASRFDFERTVSDATNALGGGGGGGQDARAERNDDARKLREEIKDLKAEVRGLRSDNRQLQMQVEQNTRDTARILRKADAIGLLTRAA